VPPYSVVVGVPARAARLRFDPDLASALEQSEWWTWSDEDLESNRELFLTTFRHDPDRAARLLVGLTGPAAYPHGSIPQLMMLSRSDDFEHGPSWCFGSETSWPRATTVDENRGKPGSHT
jgi:hypothetical protein